MAPEDRRPCRRVSFQLNASTPYWFKSLQDPEDRGLAAFRFFGLAGETSASLYENRAWIVSIRPTTS